MALFDHVNLVYGTVSEFCTSTSCPDMTGPEQRYLIILIVNDFTNFCCTLVEHIYGSMKRAKRLK